MPNPSEMTRLQEEFDLAKSKAYDLRSCKSDRERALQEYRSLGKRLGIDTPAYNGGAK